MKHRIRRISPFEAAKIAGVLYAILGLIFLPFIMLVSSAAPEGTTALPPTILIALPVLYGVFGFIFTAIGAALYNIVAGWVGGVEVELVASDATVKA